MFVTSSGGPVSARALNSTFKQLSWVLGMAECATAHSARISGSRHWAALGASEGSISALGDWRSLRVLRHYIGTARLGEQLARELMVTSTVGSSAGPPLTALAVMKAEILGALDQNKPETGIEKGFAVVSKRRPRRWHTVCCIGPSDTWRTRCGDMYNPATMVLQNWNECTAADSRCGSCR